MPEYYQERFLNIAGLTHKSVLIAMGAFLTIDGREIRIRAIGDAANNQLIDIQRLDPEMNSVSGQIVLQLSD